MILDGKKVADKIISQIKSKADRFDLKPTLAVILASEDKASKVYVKNKEKRCKELGFNSKVYEFDEKVSQKEILSLIKKLNKDENITGILVQLPLFNHLDSDEIIEEIEPIKDVDGFNPINVGKLFLKQNPYSIACTPKGIIRLLDEYNIDLKGKNVTIIGRSNIVGKPLIALLLNKDATVTIAHSKTENLKEILLKSEIIISATGQMNLVKEDMVNENSIIIDVGIIKNNDKLFGDCDFENLKDKVKAITPVPGGIGPMTIATLMENTFDLFLKQQGIGIGNAKF